MIAACQHQTCPAMRACAMALAERAALETVLEDAQTFASTLLALDQVLLPASIAAIANAAPPPGTRIQ
jgi:hypothetical protein